ncbi:hypothetical protein MAPG_11142 [Magnaporthiopsis poae ATCC 64411]|uniref:Fungal N-terminal domain-containing protein n=1 Tax=Magnaporthiopsis poae (strain ATCC 64411 / 73-15) TaxID=644358 RepID=A0A0C4EEG9_MAGP6|nr:hypothetical protein MAPG_11142 [Magnaporthiopsis poae ATCC 64411]
MESAAFGIASAGAKIAVQAAFAGVELTNAPDQIRSCLQLTHTCKESLDRLIKAKNEHRASLKPSELREVEEIINQARDRIQEVHDVFEPCCRLQPDEAWFEMKTMGRVQWTVLNSADFKHMKPGIGVLNNKVEHQITRIKIRAEHEATRSYLERALASMGLGDDRQEGDVGAEDITSDGGSTTAAEVDTSSPAWISQPTPPYVLKDEKRRLRKDRFKSEFNSFSRIFSSSLSSQKHAAAASSGSSTNTTGTSSHRQTKSLADAAWRSMRGNIFLLEDSEDGAGRDEAVAVPIVVPVSTEGEDAAAEEDTASPPA